MAERRIPDTRGFPFIIVLFVVGLETRFPSLVLGTGTLTGLESA